MTCPLLSRTCIRLVTEFPFMASVEFVKLSDVFERRVVPWIDAFDSLDGLACSPCSPLEPLVFGVHLRSRVIPGWRHCNPLVCRRSRTAQSMHARHRLGDLAGPMFEPERLERRRS